MYHSEAKIRSDFCIISTLKEPKFFFQCMRISEESTINVLVIDVFRLRTESKVTL
jgi:hypothetical protein